jgi:hypothetical protein
LEESSRFPGALKVTIKHNRNYIRMPNFPKKAIIILKRWLYQHIDNPYPNNAEKDFLSK